jgi:ubiquinone/menaquinone biosynthesis C-methylase UbiE
MNIQNAYNEWSEIYDSNTNPTRDLDQKVTRDLLVNLRFDSILELGCGTGKNTTFLSQIGKQVHALDFSHGMIEKAKKKINQENVHFSIADLKIRWPCEDEDYDLITCNLVLEHIEDLTHIFSEASRVLKLKGKFLINELHPFKQYKGTKARFERDTDTVEVETFVHHISDFTNAATSKRLKLAILNEYWHEEDKNKPPRIVSFIFERE